MLVRATINVGGLRAGQVGEMAPGPLLDARLERKFVIPVQTDDDLHPETIVTPDVDSTGGRLKAIPRDDLHPGDELVELVEGTIADVMGRVGDDKVLARRTLEVEEGRGDKARAGLIEGLRGLLGET